MESESDAAPCGTEGCTKDGRGRSAAAQSFIATLRHGCRCQSKRQRRAAASGRSASCCLSPFFQPDLMQRGIDHRMKWLNLHKLDQDRVLFNVLRDFAVTQSVHAAAPVDSSNPAEREPQAQTGKLRYNVLGVPVCQSAFQLLWGVGSRRLRKLQRAAVSRQEGPPLDLRYLQKPHERSKAKHSWVVTYLEELYESEAETLPESVDDADIHWWVDVLREAEYYDPGQVHLGRRGLAEASAAVETRWLPPGCMHEYWQLYKNLYPEHPVSFRFFWYTWKETFAHKLRFRQRQQHALCSECVAHKLVIQKLSGDVVQRSRQVALFEAHKEAQYRDRRVYWQVRAEAALSPHCVCLILDGMDQGKFAYPRAKAMSSKLLEPLQRPRLHINACIVHSQDMLVSVSLADFPKNTNVTVELIAIALSRLKARGLDLTKAMVHIQLDNTSSCNKNNQLMRWAAAMTASHIVGNMRVCFLRRGHTHEDAASMCTVGFAGCCMCFSCVSSHGSHAHAWAGR